MTQAEMRALSKLRPDWLLPLCVALAAAAPGAWALTPATGFVASELVIQTAAGKRHRFAVTIADTAARQERGLMFVHRLPAADGMLFPQAQPRIMTMWMKDTVIPLDMLFIDEHGRIACLKQRAKPQSLQLISCPQPVRAVLEIAGGQAAKRGIKIGDLVQHGIFGR